METITYQLELLSGDTATAVYLTSYHIYLCILSLCYFEQKKPNKLEYVNPKNRPKIIQNRVKLSLRLMTVCVPLTFCDNSNAKSTIVVLLNKHKACAETGKCIS